MGIGWNGGYGGGGGAVDSVFGRVGVVVAMAGDYEANLVTCTGPLGAVQVQEALDNLAATIGAVDSVFGRVGVVVAVAGDYTAAQVSCTGPLGATDVQDALDSLATTLASHGSTHTSTGSDPIPAATTAMRGTVELATSVETTAGLAVQASDTRLSDARTPTAHAPTHEDGGGDEIDVTGLSGVLADPQTPTSHGSTHASDGSDPIPAATTTVRGTVELATSVETTAGLVVQASDTRLSDARTPTAHASTHLQGGSDPIALATTAAAGLVELATSVETTAGLAVQASDTRLNDARTPTAHASTHENGGSDEIDVTGLSGVLADPQTPATHGSTHTSTGSDPIPAATTTVRGTVELATDGESAAGLAVQANDSRLSNARTPTAHASTHENGGSDEIDVTGLSGVLADPQTPTSHGSTHASDGSDPIPAATTTVRGTVELATDGESAAGLAVQANDARLSNARTPTAHASTHLQGGSDPIALATTVAAGLVELATSVETTAGLVVQASDTRLSDARTPTAHASTHENGGSDEIDVTGLSGVLADPQTPATHGSTHASDGSDPIPAATTTVRGTVELATSVETTAGLAVQASDTRLSDARTPTAHASTHENGGGDEIDVTGLSGVLADPQTPTSHGSTHASDGSDPIPAATTTVRGTVELATDGESAAGLAVQANDARLSNARTPTSHASTHQNGGSDEISVAGLSGQLADPQTVQVSKNSGVAVGARPTLNFIEGTNVTLTIADDAGDDEIDITITASGSGGAPTDAEYLVGALSGGLSAERLVTDTATCAWDLATAGQAKVNVIDASISNAKIANRLALSVMGRSSNSAGSPADISTTAGSGLVLRESGNVLAFGEIGTTGIADSAVTMAKMANITTDTLIGRDSAGTGVPESIGVGGGIEFSGTFSLRRSALSGDVAASAGSNTTTIQADVVDNTKLANMVANTVKGRLSSTGDPQDLTQAQLTTLINLFTSVLAGAVPASGGGTTNFLRADGTWAAPPGGGSGLTQPQVLTRAFFGF